MTTSTGESAEEIPTEVLRRWDLSAIKEYLKRIWASMHGDDERVPRDYEDDVADRVVGIITRKYGRHWHVQYNNGDGQRNSRNDQPHGEKRLLSWILGVLSALAVIVIVGGVTMYGEVTALKAMVTTGMTAHEQRIGRLENDRDRARSQPGAP